MTRRRLRRAGWIGAIAYWLGGVCVAGCSLASPEIGHLRTELSAIRGDVAAVQGDVAAIQATAGRDVNEPITGWILAVGYATIPATLLLYVVGHRFRWFRAAKDVIRGLPR